MNSHTDYTQPEGERVKRDLPMKFHYFYTALLGLSTVSLALGGMGLLTNGAILTALVYFFMTVGYGLLCYGFITRRRAAIIVFKWLIYISLGSSIISALLGIAVSTFFGSMFGVGVQTAIFFGLIFAVILFIAFGINFAILKYYKKREHLFH